MYKNKSWFDDDSLPENPLRESSYGKLIINSYAGKRKRVPYWNCDCECGEKVTVSMYNLLNSKTTSCGCYRKELMTETVRGKAVDIVGERFGKLLVLENAGRIKGLLVCKTICDCGNYKVIYKHHILSGNTRSCGCLYKEMNKNSEPGWTLFKKGKYDY